MEDESIIGLYFARDEQAIAETKQKYGRLIVRIGQNLLSSREDREECESDTYLGLWNAMPPAHPDPLAAFIVRVARNIAIGVRRRLGAEKRRGDSYGICLEELSEILPAPSVEEHFSAAELGRAIDAFLETVEKSSRVLFVRRYFYGESVQTLAGELSERENTVSARLTRTRRALREYLQKEGFGV